MSTPKLTAVQALDFEDKQATARFFTNWRNQLLVALGPRTKVVRIDNYRFANQSSPVVVPNPGFSVGAVVVGQLRAMGVGVNAITAAPFPIWEMAPNGDVRITSILGAPAKSSTPFTLTLVLLAAP